MDRRIELRAVPVEQRQFAPSGNLVAEAAWKATGRGLSMLGRLHLAETVLYVQDRVTFAFENWHKDNRRRSAVNVFGQFSGGFQHGMTEMKDFIFTESDYSRVAQFDFLDLSRETARPGSAIIPRNLQQHYFRTQIQN